MSRYTTWDFALQQWADFMQAKAMLKVDQSRHLSYVREFRSHSGAGHPATATLTEMMNWVNQPDGRHFNTKAYRLKALRAFFKFCMASKFTDHNPAAAAVVNRRELNLEQKERRESVIWTEAEYRLMVDSTSGFWRDAVILARHTGLRLGDVAMLERASLATPGRLTIWTRKKGTRLELDLADFHEELRDLVTRLSVLPAVPTTRAEAIAFERELIRRHLTDREFKALNSRYVFPFQARLYLKDGSAVLSKQFSELRTRVGIPPRRFHALRAFAAIDLQAQGVPLLEISKRLGHANPETTIHHYLNRQQTTTTDGNATTATQTMDEDHPNVVPFRLLPGASGDPETPLAGVCPGGQLAGPG